MTGELYDADIGFSESIARLSRREVVEVVDPLTWMSNAHAPAGFLSPWSRGRMQYLCDIGANALLNAQFGFEVLAVRGLEADGPEADKYVRQRATARLEVHRWRLPLSRSRSRSGQPAPFQPVPGSKQKQALSLLRSHLFAPDAFAYSPRLLNKLNNERFSDFSNPGQRCTGH
jgi:hypothetical protein